MDKADERRFLLTFVSIIGLAVLFTALAHAWARDNALASARRASHPLTGSSGKLAEWNERFNPRAATPCTYTPSLQYQEQ